MAGSADNTRRGFIKAISLTAGTLEIPAAMAEAKPSTHEYQGPGFYELKAEPHREAGVYKIVPSSFGDRSGPWFEISDQDGSDISFAPKGYFDNYLASDRLRAA